MTHIEKTIELLRAGWTTALESAQKGGCLSLSQRVGELRRHGYTVRDVWVDTKSGARIKAYRISRLPRKQKA